MSSSEPDALGVGPGTLRIHFARGERPHLFWIAVEGVETGAVKVLSKRLADGSLEAVIVRDDGTGRPALSRVEIPATAPSGWLTHWVERWSRESRVRLACFDLRHVTSLEEWRRATASAGWRGPRRSRPRED